MSFEPRAIIDRPAYFRAVKRNFSKKGEQEVNALFRRFNLEFFGGRLPQYKVEFVRWIPNGRCVGPNSSVGTCLRRERTIRLDGYMLHDWWDLAATLLHEMIHAAGIPRHGEKFAAEAQRLAEMGAPVSEEETVTPQLVRAVVRWTKEHEKAKPGKGEGRR